MKGLVIFCLFLAVVAALPSPDQPQPFDDDDHPQYQNRRYMQSLSIKFADDKDADEGQEDRRQQDRKSYQRQDSYHLDDDDHDDGNDYQSLRLNQQQQSSQFNYLVKQVDQLSSKYHGRGTLRVYYTPAKSKSTPAVHYLGALNFQYIMPLDNKEVYSQYQQKADGNSVQVVPLYYQKHDDKGTNEYAAYPMAQANPSYYSYHKHGDNKDNDDVYSQYQEKANGNSPQIYPYYQQKRDYNKGANEYAAYPMAQANPSYYSYHKHGDNVYSQYQEKANGNSPQIYPYYQQKRDYNKGANEYAAYPMAQANPSYYSYHKHGDNKDNDDVYSQYQEKANGNSPQIYPYYQQKRDYNKGANEYAAYPMAQANPSYYSYHKHGDNKDNDDVYSQYQEKAYGNSPQIYPYYQQKRGYNKLYQNQQKSDYGNQIHRYLRELQDDRYDNADNDDQ
ncbi:calcium-responsive transactivator-like isoform X6 [Galleria mellonella]|uniref:Calcium-responsive transactivator-like isoform X6 n=1 Tax=Galleria mellonella TaxID=7137 RepID=A0ABM3M9D8_GALME|nr:calcium-responsive transactivator-like isoform X6 [Galleria mellonella]